MHRSLNLGLTYEEEMIKYNNLQLHTEYFLSTFQKIFD